MAVAALVLGIIGLLTCWFFLGGILGLIGLVLGIIGINKASKGQAGGKGLAIAGTVLSGFAIAGTVVVVVAFTAIFGGRISTYQKCLNNAQTSADRQACVDQLGNSFLSPTPS